MNARAQLLLSLADDELILGWRDSEWTGIAPTLEEDVAFSSIAQNEIGHARALYELAAAELGTDADALAFDRAPDEYRCAPLVELAGLAAKIDREEIYHRMHAEMWAARLRGEPRFIAAVAVLWPYALGVLEPDLREELSRRVGIDVVEANERGTHTPELTELWDVMTEVRRSVPGAQW